MDFRILGLSPRPFISLFGLSDKALEQRGARRQIADAHPGFPDRIELRDALPGEPLILLNFYHQPAPTPYRACHAVFVLENAKNQYDTVNQVPEVLRRRMISLRAFDRVGHMLDATLIDGSQLETGIADLLRRTGVDYLHAHYAARGCYAARIERA